MSERLELTRGLVAWVSDEDYERVSGWKYRAVTKKGYQTFYALRSTSRSDGPRRGVYLHQDILPVPADFEVHHKDGNTLNCRRDNLEPRTRKQNMQGIQKKRPGCSSSYRGVRAKDGKWEAWIQPTGNPQYLGRYSTEFEAAKAYDAAAQELFGVFAALNFPAGKAGFSSG